MNVLCCLLLTRAVATRPLLLNNIQFLFLIRLNETTYTVEEVGDLLADVASVIETDVDSELINSAHTNVLLLQQVFGQAEKWHLNLDADLAELENRCAIQSFRLAVVAVI